MSTHRLMNKFRTTKILTNVMSVMLFTEATVANTIFIFLLSLSRFLISHYKASIN